MRIHGNVVDCLDDIMAGHSDGRVGDVDLLYHFEAFQETEPLLTELVRGHLMLVLPSDLHLLSVYPLRSFALMMANRKQSLEEAW